MSTKEQMKNVYMNRELSWLQFNERVLLEAADRQVPLLERLKFISIFHSNLDEFFMVRVGSFADRMLTEPKQRDKKTGWTAAEQLGHILKAVSVLTKKAVDIYEVICAELQQFEIDILKPDTIEKVDALMLQNYFNNTLRYLLSPQLVDRSHPFPFLKNGEQYIAILFDTKEETKQFGIIPLGNLPSIYVYNLENRQKIAFTAEIVAEYAHKLFGRQKIKEVNIIRVTRSADLRWEESVLEEESDTDYRRTMEQLIKVRRRLAPVRLQFWKEPSMRMQDILCRQLEMEKEYLFTARMPLDFGFVFQLQTKGKSFQELYSDLCYPKQKPAKYMQFKRGEALAYVEKKDLLLHFPFQTIQPFVDLLYDAGDDPHVTSIKISLYRLANHSKIVAALVYAAEHGKEVNCLLELRARFDEQNNIDYAKMLEEAGCNISYGLPGYKVHAKLCLITKRHHDRISYITQIGTGNYNEKTAESYTDLSLITSDYEIGKNANAVFQALSCGEFAECTNVMWAAPLCYKTNVLKMIDGEIAAQKRDGSGYIAIKVNSMNDMEVMKKLVEASQTGVKIELVIRGICCLRAGVEGLTEQITIKSIIGRYLEHSRIFCFGTGKRRQLYIGSGDLLSRNTERRVEVFVKILKPKIQKEIMRVLNACLKDDKKGWRMNADGRYVKVRQKKNKWKDSQQYLYDYYHALKPEQKKADKWAWIKWLRKEKRY